MISPTKQHDNHQQHPDGLTRTGSPARQPYEAPAIIFEGAITTRAGSRPGPPPKDVAPEKLFGGGI